MTKKELEARIDTLKKELIDLTIRHRNLVEAVGFLMQYGKNKVEVVPHPPIARATEFRFIYNGRLTTCSADLHYPYTVEIVENDKTHFIAEATSMYGIKRFYKIDKETKNYVEITDLYKIKKIETKKENKANEKD